MDVSKNGAFIKNLIQSERPNTFIHQINKQMDFAPFSGFNAKMTLLSNSPKLEKMFARFDLDSIQVTVKSSFNINLINFLLIFNINQIENI